MGIIYLAFANSQLDPLESLKKEDDTICGLLSRRATKQHFILEHDSNTSLDKIADYLIRNKDQISLFLFSGHAGRDALLIDDEKTNAIGIAQLLGQCPNLKVVILNGCSTGGQVEALLENKVPAVIATSAPVNDMVATKFSISFFQALTEGFSNLGTAFELGLATALAYKSDLQAHRHFIFSISKKGEITSEKATWGLFTHESRPDIKDWKLPMGTVQFDQEDFVPNELLIDQLLEDFSPYSKEAKDIYDEEMEGAEKSILDKREVILKCLPHPISEQLRKLLVAESSEQGGTFYDKPGAGRLKQMIRVYDTIIELITFIMLAQLWDHVNDSEETKIPDSLMTILKGFFKMKPEERDNYNFLSLFRTLISVFENKKFDYFIEEIGKHASIFEENTEFSLACYFMESHKNRQFEENEAKQLCIPAEENLATILGNLGFVSNYTLASIKEIDVIKYKHRKEAKYKHKMVKLVQRFVGLAEEQSIKANFWDSSSVLLIREKKEEEKQESASYLNLSPFVIDENAYSENKEKVGVAKLHFFTRYEPTMDAYAFKHVYKPEDMPLVIMKQKGYRMLKEQFDAFSSALFQQPMKLL